MKAIVVYYSLTGKTRSIAEGLAKELGCEAKRIEEVRKRSVLGAYVLGAFAAMRGKTSEIVNMNIDMQAYDTVVIATPVWASSPVPAVNAFVANNSFENKDAVVIISSASGDGSKAATLLTNKILAKGGTVLKHHDLKTNGLKEADITNKTKEIAGLYM